ncbi:early nodulin-93-like isoform X1 [Juglans regia]|uniref:Early nodulin-93-like isoform X1 n=1 Tax=Juglans regia TaxID=51240 RepID=A0A6P9ERV6_JUGRE|nr:early nodulin-93-like isoform X1 [Juglans regia]
MAKNVAGSPLERNSLASLDQKLAMAKRCSHEGVIAGAKAAVIASIATAIPTVRLLSHYCHSFFQRYNHSLAICFLEWLFSKIHKVLVNPQVFHFGLKSSHLLTHTMPFMQVASARMLPWARANLNHTAQALIISTVAGAAYFIVADKTVLATARRNSFQQLSKNDV